MDWTIGRERNEGLLTLRHRPDGKIERLAAVALFDGCSRKDLAAIARRIDFVQVSPGSILMTEGNPANQVVLVSRGKLQVLRNGVESGLAGRGEMFGEMEAISHLPYSETLVAGSDAEVAVLGTRDFLDLLDQIPCLALKILQRVARRHQQVA
ncbi:MAG TPA: cyclic nucleotide-binding domain-containing protein [Actinomycetota bacterium]|nr:cyclic nucleotide-binding domain-containing protein [Actinomycetota bacterium]